MLTRLDPESAARLHPNDRQRVQRALEVRLITGQPMARLWGKRSDADMPRPVGVGLYMPREPLVERIAAKVSAMLEQGWIEETKRLEDQGLLDAVIEAGPIGYQHIREYLAGRTSYERMRDLAIVGTRQYAKRQMTWFRGVSYLQWFLYHPKTGYNVKDLISFIKDRFG
jgi:tRNA dimethylallyltransferase